MNCIQQVRRYPFLRLLLPLIGGIGWADCLYFRGAVLQQQYILFPLFITLLLLASVYLLKRYALRYCWGVLVCLFFFLLGMELTVHRLNQTTYSFPDEPAVYKALIESTPEIKSNSVYCQAVLSDGYDSLAFPVSKRVLLYFAADSASHAIKRGDEVIFRARLSLPRNNGNPDEFDYPRYLLRKGISGTGFVAAGNWQQTVRTSSKTLKETALNCRDYILGQYRKLGFEGEEFAVLSALTVGYKEELSEDIRESFAASGAAHILALSGLHVGFIFGILFFVFHRCFGSSGAAVWFRAIVVALLLWAFAFITGLSPSVVRSVFMFSLLAFSFLRDDRPLTIHLLTVAAFCMLLYHPAWLFDIGFQLSYMAVWGIVLFQPGLYRLFRVGNPVFKYLWGIMTVSLAAQVATAPLVAYYFFRFPVYFLLTNLLVIPLVTLIVTAAVCMLALWPLPGTQQWLAGVLQLLIKALNYSARWVEQLPCSSAHTPWLHSWDVFVLYLALLSFSGLIVSRHKKYLFMMLGCILFIPVHRIWLQTAELPYTGIAFYNVRNSPAVHCITDTGNSWLVYADTIPETEKLPKLLSRNWNRRGLNTPAVVTGDYEHVQLMCQNNILHFNGKRVCILNDNRWNNIYSDNPLRIDYLYICKGFTRNIVSMASLFTVDCVVIDASLPVYRKNALAAECRELQIPYILLDEGALVVHIKEV